MNTKHEALMRDPEFRKLLSAEKLVAEASELIAQLMAEQTVTRAELARRLGKSRAWVTQLLSGSANMTVRTLAEVTHALDMEVKLHSQVPAWKLVRSPRSAQRSGFVYRMNNQVLGSPSGTGDLFHLVSCEEPATREHSPDEDVSLRPEYAA